MTFDIETIAAGLTDDGDKYETEILTNGAESRDDRGTSIRRLPSWSCSACQRSRSWKDITDDGR